MPRQRRQPVRRAAVRPRRSDVRRNNWFAVLAVLTIIAMLVGALGSAVFLDVFNETEQATEVAVDEEDETERQFRADVAARPNDAEAIGALANYLSQTEDADEALRLYEQALTLTPDDVELRLDFAEALSAAGSPRDAELQFTRVVEAQPENGLAMLSLARLYRDWSPPRLDEAVATYQRVTALGADSVVVQIANEELTELGVGTPVSRTAATPAS